MSQVFPYFIVGPEKLTRPHELPEVNNRRSNDDLNVTGVVIGPREVEHYNTPVEEDSIKLSKKKLFSYKPSIKDIKKRDALTKKMEYIKQKLEKSRERFNARKESKEEAGMRCQPTVIGFGELGERPFKLDRSATDPGPTGFGTKTGESQPYVYFVVSEDDNENNTIILDDGERLVSKSADKRRRVRIVEENRLKRDRRERQSKAARMQGLARELGLRSSLKTDDKSSDSDQPTRRQPAINHIVFPGDSMDTDPYNFSSKVHMISSPPDISTSTFDNILPSEVRYGEYSDPDESVPRKPFLSGPLYAGKTRVSHSYAVPRIEMPNISPEQKRRALGLSSAARFEEFSMQQRPKLESKQQKRVVFADQLPVIKGSAFSGMNDLKDDNLPLYSRSATMGSITLPSERVDKQSMCQKYLLGENISSARVLRRSGIPMSLPKIDIVSNVYDEMIIKMIKEYLQDTNTPSRQSQLAKDLLVHLQKNNERMQEIGVPNLSQKSSEKLMKADLVKCQNKLQKRTKSTECPVPPNTAEERTRTFLNDDNGVVTTEDKPQDNDDNTLTTEPSRSIPFIQITFKQINDECNEAGNVTNDKIEDTKPNGLTKSAKERRQRDPKPPLSPVTPTSFQMAPPGLSKEDTQSSIQLKT